MTVTIADTRSGARCALGSAIILLAVAISITPFPAAAITAELAKKCESIVSTAFPPRQIGNPASGSAKGNSKTQREYYNKCVANGGKIDAEEKK